MASSKNLFRWLVERIVDDSMTRERGNVVGPRRPRRFPVASGGCDRDLAGRFASRGAEPCGPAAEVMKEILSFPIAQNETLF
jgi:hypothetical protein